MLKNFQYKRSTLCIQLLINLWLLILDVKSFFDSNFKIIFAWINNWKVVTWIAWFTCFTRWQMFLNGRRWSAMFLDPCGQMSDCFTNVGTIRVTQTCEFINFIGQQRERSMALQRKIISHFKRGENNSNINTIVILE